MDLYYIDYVSVCGRSWLHRFPSGAKMLVFAGVVGLLLWVRSLSLLAAVAAGVLIIATTARLPMRIFLPLTFYPLVFLVIIFLSISGLTVLTALTLALRVLAITGSIVTLFLTTSYPAIFGTLGRILPGFLVAALFFAYRSIFVISDSLSNIRTAMHLRGGIDWKRPVFTVRHLGTALGHFLAHSMETSEHMADSLRARGFANRIYYLDGKK